MKKTLLLAAALLPGILAAQDSLILNNYSVKRGEKIGNCSGNKGNICEFEKTGNKTKISLAMESHDRIQMGIDLAGASLEEKNSWIGKSWDSVEPGELLYFHQEYAVSLHPQLIAELQLDPNFSQIAPGNYLLVIGQDKITVIFRLIAK